MDSAPLATNPVAIRDFIDALFRYADEDSWTALRVLRQHDNEAPPMRRQAMPIAPVRVRDLAAGAAEVAQWAAAHEQPSVVCPPIATFATTDSAAMDNMANGLVITVDVDEADPRESRHRLTDLLGPPTVVVDTGSVWTCDTTCRRARTA